MKLKSFGCSFIWGSELSDEGVDVVPFPTPSKLTWPANLARHYDYDYWCYARPGTGNLQIAEQVLNQAALDDPAFYVIGWTWINRYDYYPTIPTDKSISPWRTIMPVDENEVSKTYYKYIQSDYCDKLTHLMYIKTVIDTLKKKDLPFIMTFLDDLLFDTKWHTGPAVLELQEYIRPYITQFDGKNFLNWSRDKGFPETALWHPLEEAHQAATDYMTTVFDKQKTSGPTR
jgi:hypothetical protein